ncbi:MAG: hypothetical protein LAO07_04725, partial [Acidobacteriia bacterium]|nr:hypothetical protein [Terriglobia bacterium]
MTVRSESLGGLVVLLFAGLFAASQLATWPNRLRYPGESNYVDGMRLVEMLHLRQGVPIYALPSAERFDAAIYGPLYYLLGARLIDASAPAYLPLRLLSALGALGLAAGCGLLAFWLTRSPLAATLAPPLFLSYALVTRHGTSARSDMVALFLVFTGFLVAFRFQGDRRILLALPFMLLGFFYKQQYVAGPVAVLLVLVIEKRYRTAMWFLGLLISGGLALLALFQFVIFAGQAFLSHFILYNAVGFSWQQLKYAGLLYAAVVLLLPVLLGRTYLRKHPNRMMHSYLAVSIVLSLITAGKVGSGSHYWFEPLLIVSALVAALVAERIEGFGKPGGMVLLLASVLVLARVSSAPSPTPRDLARDQAIQAYLHRRFPPGTPALSHWAGDMARAGLDLPVSDSDQYRYLVREGILSDQPLLD